MSDHRALRDHRKVAANRVGGRGSFFAGLAVVTLIRASDAMAADQPAGLAVLSERNQPRLPSVSTQPLEPQTSSRAAAAATPMPAFATARYGKWGLPPMPPSIDREWRGPDSDSSTEFRPRGRSMFGTEPPPDNLGDNLEFDKTVWERLSEYRTRDRVRVLTLWESSASAVSLQTDRKGGPSLQWTSRWMNRGGATRGLLDRWLPASLFRGFSRPGNPAGKPANPNLPLMHPETGATP